MATYKVLNRVKTASGYDILNPMTPFDVLSCSAVSISGTTVSCTTTLPAEAFLSDQDFTIAFAIPSDPTGVTTVSVNSTSYTLSTNSQSSFQASAIGDVVMLYIDVSALTANMFNMSAVNAVNAQHANTADSATTATTANSVPGTGITGTVPVTAGGTGANNVTGAKTNLGFATSASYTGTLGTTWSGTGPYTQTVTINGILASDAPIVDIVLTGTAATDEPRLEGWGLVGRITTAANQLNFTCYSEAPTVSLPIKILCVR